MSDHFRSVWEQHEALRRATEMLGGRHHLDLVGDTYKRLGIDSAVMDFIHQEREHQKLLSGLMGVGAIQTAAAEIEQQRKFLEGPLEEARRLGLFDPASDIQKSITATLEARRAYESMFRLPQAIELATLAHEAAQATELARTMFHDQGVLQTAMAGLQSPWLQIEESATSARAFAEILAIGQGIDTRSAFDHELVRGLRVGLGDWRDAALPTFESLVNPIIRSGYYQEQGFDPALTDFTPTAFHEGLRIAGLCDSESVEDFDEENDDGFARARQAFDRLQRFEILVRRFISQVMHAAFGADWMKQRLPPTMLDAWISKRDKAVKAGQMEQPLIDYADFSDYYLIIERKDNWNTAFRPIFGRPEDVRESFQRLFPVRIATMHARIVTQDDELLLFVETKRVTKAIRDASAKAAPGS